MGINSRSCWLRNYFSIVIPCRNEQETIAATIQEAEVTIQKLGVVAEIIVADNASDDDSREIASEAGARIIQVSELGYGSALKAGIAAARGTFVILGDADGSYDFVREFHGDSIADFYIAYIFF